MHNKIYLLSIAIKISYFFLNGPTTKNYRWRDELINLIELELSKKLINTADVQIYFIIPEGHFYDLILHGKEITQNDLTDNKIVLYENDYKDLYETLEKKYNMNKYVINQIMWEAHGRRIGYNIYNICYSWTHDPSMGMHGNIGPTARLENHPHVGDNNKSIYYNNFHTDLSKNTEQEVIFGGECDGKNIGWLNFWIELNKIKYAHSPKELIEMICSVIIEVLKNIRFKLIYENYLNMLFAPINTSSDVLQQHNNEQNNKNRLENNDPFDELYKSAINFVNLSNDKSKPPKGCVKI